MPSMYHYEAKDCELSAQCSVLSAVYFSHSFLVMYKYNMQITKSVSSEGMDDSMHTIFSAVGRIFGVEIMILIRKRSRVITTKLCLDF